MPNKKTDYADDEIPIFDEAVVHLRGEYWQMRMWLAKEGKYARFSLKTRNRDTAIDKAKKYYHELKAGELAGKTYFSLTTKQGVEMYLAQRKKDVGEHIVEGRHRTLVTHLKHFLKFIGKDTKLKELHRTDCENYFIERRQTKKRNEIKISQSTIVNEQATINAMMTWLFRRNETYIDRFDFKKLKPIDAGDLALKRPIFSKEELSRINKVLFKYVRELADDKNDKNNATKALCGHYHALSMRTGMRRGEMLQLKWKDISFKDSVYEYKTQNGKRLDAIVFYTIPGTISKPRRTRQFMTGDESHLMQLLYLAAKRVGLKGLANEYSQKVEGFLLKNVKALQKIIANDLVFSIDGEAAITPRAIYIHFERILERAEIENVTERGVVPYSFRHSFITHKVNSGLDLMTVAEMAGTSITQIEKAYYRTTKEKMLSNALTDYDFEDGLIVKSSEGYGQGTSGGAEPKPASTAKEVAAKKTVAKKAATKNATAKAKPVAKKVVAKKVAAKKVARKATNKL